jgi:hypothetical protein
MVASCKVASCKVASCKVTSCKVASCKVASCKVASCTGIVFLCSGKQLGMRCRYAHSSSKGYGTVPVFVKMFSCRSDPVVVDGKLYGQVSGCLFTFYIRYLCFI